MGDLDHTGGAPNLGEAPLLIVDEEQMRLRVLFEIALRDVLSIAGEVGKADRVLVKHL